MTSTTLVTDSYEGSVAIDASIDFGSMESTRIAAAIVGPEPDFDEYHAVGAFMHQAEVRVIGERPRIVQVQTVAGRPKTFVLQRPGEVSLDVLGEVGFVSLP